MTACLSATARNRGEGAIALSLDHSAIAFWIMVKERSHFAVDELRKMRSHLSNAYASIPDFWGKGDRTIQAESLQNFLTGSPSRQDGAYRRH